jgi:SAM-dependent methyltransferase
VTDVAPPRAGLHPAVDPLLRCPLCHGELDLGDPVTCVGCGARYPWRAGVASLIPAGPDDRKDLSDWTAHWEAGNQGLVSQRFFSWYRHVIFAPTVAHYFREFFPERGVFLEAGCGTSETSERIPKHGGNRVLIAADLVPEIAARAHPVMDVRMACDAFQLPFATGSLDGIWNVGVMEHFLHADIDRMVREFARVLRPGAPLVMLWPARTSIPQRLLRIAEFFINLRPRPTRFRFHPDEISQLRSSAEGFDVLRRNGLQPVEVSGEWRSLFAFKVVVGRR